MHESIMLSYINLVLGTSLNLGVRTMTCSHGVIGAANPIQLKPWTKPALVAGQYDTKKLT